MEIKIGDRIWVGRGHWGRGYMALAIGVGIVPHTHRSPAQRGQPGVQFRWFAHDPVTMWPTGTLEDKTQWLDVKHCRPV